MLSFPPPSPLALYSLSLHTIPIQKSWLGQWDGEPIVSILPIQTHHKYVSWEVSGARQVPIL